MDVVILEHVAKFLSIHDIKSLMILSKGSNRLANSETLFKFLFYRDFGQYFTKSFLQSFIPPSQLTYKKLYQMLYHTKLEYLHKCRINAGLISQPKENTYQYALNHYIINLDFRFHDNGRDDDFCPPDDFYMYIEKFVYLNPSYLMDDFEYCSNEDYLDIVHVKHKLDEFILIETGVYCRNQDKYEFLFPKDILLVLLKYCRNLVAKENYWPEKFAPITKLLKQKYTIHYKSGEYDDVNIDLYDHEYAKCVSKQSLPKYLDFLRPELSEDFRTFEQNVCWHLPNFRYYLDQCIYPYCGKQADCSETGSYKYCDLHDRLEFQNVAAHYKTHLENYYEERLKFNFDLKTYDLSLIVNNPIIIKYTLQNGESDFVSYKYDSITIKEPES